jgi:prephenate dehydrogenase
VRKNKWSQLTVGLIGLGQIGGSLALAFRKQRLFKEILGYDINQATFREAWKRRLVEAASQRLSQVANKSDLIILAIPVRQIIGLLPKVAKILKPETILCETGSTKEEILSLVEKLKIGNFIGLHPVAGTEKEGIKGWEGNLFNGKTFTMTPSKNCSPPAKTVIKAMIKRIGGNPLEISAREHDRIFSKTSHLPYLISVAITNAVFPYSREKSLTKYLGGAFRDATRVALSSPVVMRDILFSNRENVIREINAQVGRLKEYQKFLEKQLENRLMAEMRQARKIRSNLQL